MSYKQFADAARRADAWAGGQPFIVVYVIALGCELALMALVAAIITVGVLLWG